MVSLEPEILDWKEKGLLEPEFAEALVRLERREIWSVHWELRFLIFAGISLMVGAAVTFLSQNSGEGVHLIAMVAIALASTLCFAWYFRRSREGEQSHAEQILVLGSLLLSADLAYAEVRYHFLDSNWSLHLLLMALINGVIAYRARSRAMLVLSITSLVGWIGVDRYGLFLSHDLPGLRVIGAGLALIVWLAIHEKLTASQWSAKERFRATLEHLSLILTAVGGLICLGGEALVFGLVAVIGVALWSMVRARNEGGVIWFVYLVMTVSIASMILLARFSSSSDVTFLLNIMIAIAGIAALFMVVWRRR